MKVVSVVNFHTKPGDSYHLGSSNTKLSALMLVTHGKVTYFINGQPISLHPGDMMFMPANTFRSCASDTESGYRRYTLLLDTTDDEGDLSILFKYKNLKFNTLRSDYIKQRLSLAHGIWMDKSLYYEMITYGVIMEIIGILQRELLSKTVHSVKMNLVAQAQRFMHEHYRENVLITDIAQHLDRTPNYLSTIFKEVTGKTLKEYLKHLRISVASDLLLHSQMTIGEISDYLGFCDQAYFNYIYKKSTGESPSSYSKKNR